MQNIIKESNMTTDTLRKTHPMVLTAAAAVTILRV
jgi:hypothetical protein